MKESIKLRGEYYPTDQEKIVGIARLFGALEDEKLMSARIAGRTFHFDRRGAVTRITQNLGAKRQP